jgi:hypothetical protein
MVFGDHRAADHLIDRPALVARKDSVVGSRLLRVVIDDGCGPPIGAPLVNPVEFIDLGLHALVSSAAELLALLGVRLTAKALFSADVRHGDTSCVMS